MMHVDAVLDTCNAVTWVSWACKIIHSLKGCWVSRPTDSCSCLFYLQNIALNEQDKHLQSLSDVAVIQVVRFSCDEFCQAQDAKCRCICEHLFALDLSIFTCILDKSKTSIRRSFWLVPLNISCSPCSGKLKIRSCLWLACRSRHDTSHCSPQDENYMQHRTTRKQCRIESSIGSNLCKILELNAAENVSVLLGNDQSLVYPTTCKIQSWLAVLSSSVAKGNG